MSWREMMTDKARGFMAANAMECPYDEVDLTGLEFDDHGWFSDENEESLKAIIETIGEDALPGSPPGKLRGVIELGSWLGKSTRFFAERAEYVIAVDHWSGSAEHHDQNRTDTWPRLPRLFPQFLFNMIATGHKNVVPVRMDTWEAHCSLRFPGDVDLVYVDASHNYDAVWQDVFDWRDVLSPRGFICGDDYTLPDVQRAVDDVARQLLMRVFAKGPFWVLVPDVAGRMEATRPFQAIVDLKESQL